MRVLLYDSGRFFKIRCKSVNDTLRLVDGELFGEMRTSRPDVIARLDDAGLTEVQQVSKWKFCPTLLPGRILFHGREQCSQSPIGISNDAVDQIRSSFDYFELREPFVDR